jgi:hypothetical protein
VILRSVDPASSREPLATNEHPPAENEARDRPSHPERARAGRAEARRVTSAGLADLAEREAKALAALDRAFEARLGEFDRAFATRRTHLEGRLTEAESGLTEAIDAGVAAFRRAASDERRLLHEEAAARLDEFDRATREHLRHVTEVASDELASLDELSDRIRELERRTDSLHRDLAEREDGIRGGTAET